jgi:hypothetical protein
MGNGEVIVFVLIIFGAGVIIGAKIDQKIEEYLEEDRKEK